MKRSERVLVERPATPARPTELIAQALVGRWSSAQITQRCNGMGISGPMVRVVIKTSCREHAAARQHSWGD